MPFSSIFNIQNNLNMLDQLLKTLVSQGQEQVIQNPAIPNEYNQQVLGEAGNSIVSGMQGMLANGGLSQIMGLLSGSGATQQNQGAGLAGLLSNPMVQNIVQSFTGKITQQYNINPAAAAQVGNSLIPQVLQSLTQRVNDPADSSIDFNSVIQSLTGGQAGSTNFNDLASRFSSVGGDVDGDGDADLQDIIASVSGAARNQQQTSGGGIMDMISGLLK
jgi:hypothetical protein